MKRKRIKFASIIGIILLLIIGIVCINKNKNQETDALKFKEEYESLNGITTEDGNTYPTVEVNKNNVMHYATSEEILEVLKEGTGVICFATPSDPWSRNAINILLQAADSTAISMIYYLDLSKKYDFYEVKESKVEKTKEGSSSYYEMVEILSPYLDNYLINDGKNTIDTGVKRIFMPFVVFVQEGKIISTREGTTSSHMNNGNGYIELSQKEEEEIFNYYVDKMTIIADASCNDAC